MTTQKFTYLMVFLIFVIFLNNFNVECRPNYNQNRQLIEQIMQPDYSQSDQENTQDYFDKMAQISENDPNFLSNWPYLRELLKLKELSSKDSIQYEMIPTPQPLQQIQPQPNRNLIKDSAQKKNSNYMHACHFKICNMGRKRNVRYDY
ncbi:uncharacterized protein LOC129610365 [Condylostylus longicornis]|uniref:uncharacterized protein LOC129610365 n=1 Tax=Condylostylus longicornis TaxID=2530218 RepID=UPI00244DDCDE|nr:uncharacterized protein LOC129610365 [Condylostylus longicornis]